MENTESDRPVSWQKIFRDALKHIDPDMRRPAEESALLLFEEIRHSSSTCGLDNKTYLEMVAAMVNYVKTDQTKEGPSKYRLVVQSLD